MAAPAPPAQALPTGTVTFLFTDVEGSTRLWERHPDQMRAALAEHDALIEFLTEQHGGVTVRPRGEGDSRFCVFARATDAVAAAAAMQKALQEQGWPPEAPLRVRMALHTGEADVRDGDYYGGAVNRAARLRAIAHGGQTLLSMATEELVRDALPEGAALRDLGEHRLKDLGRPERVFQLAATGLPAAFGPLVSLDALPHNLPVQVTSFVGRERELAEVACLLGSTRLLTLIGPGGTGKTRLALQSAADALHDYPGGVWLVELAPLADGALVPQAIASALGVRETAGHPLLDTLVDALVQRRLLLLVDNCEHLVAACACVAAHILRRCPAVTLLATSREPLGIAGEVTRRVPSLALPDPEAGAPPPVDALRHTEAVRLFLDRAQAVRSDVALTERNAPAIVQVCRRLDGMPLALELAAARLRALSVEQLAARLDDVFRLLTGGSRTALERHQTLRAAVDWSYGLLTDPEKRLFDRLAVFAGGFTLEAAEAVCANHEESAEDGREIAAGDVLDLLAHLVDKSLVLAEERPDGTTRYRLLEPLRQYARERLVGGGAVEARYARHAAFYLGAAEAWGAKQLNNDAQAAVWVTRIERDLDNIRASLRWFLDERDAERGLRLTLALELFWRLHGHMVEESGWLDAFLELGSAAPAPLRARGLAAAGHRAMRRGDCDRAAAQLEASAAVWQEIGDQDGWHRALILLAFNAWLSGEHDHATQLLERCLVWARQRDERARVAQILRDLAHVARTQGNLGRARERLEESIATAEGAADVLTYGHYWRGVACLGRIAFLEGRHGEAAAHLRRCLTHARASSWVAGAADSLEWLAPVVAAGGMAQQAARLFGAADALRRRAGDVRYAPDQAGYARDLAAVRAELGGQAFARAWSEGQAMSADQAIACALDTAKPAAATTD